MAWLRGRLREKRHVESQLEAILANVRRLSAA